MNILLFTLEYPPFKGGVANYYENLVKYWPSNTGTSDDKPDIYRIFVLNNNDGKLIRSWLFPKWLLSFYYLYKEIKKNNIDHVLVGHLLPLGTVTYLIAKFTGTPYSVFIHGMDFAFSQKSDRKRKISKKILEKAVQIICSNSYVAGLINQAYSNEYSSKIFIVTPGVDQELRIKNYELRIIEDKKLPDLKNKIILFSVGRLVKRKGFDKVIEALPEVLKLIPNLIYVIAGTGPDEEYLKNKAINLKNNVVLLGKISEEEKWTWMKNCDIFITVSRNIEGDFEGFGIVYLEANLVGKPVIAGNSGGVKDAVIDNETGLLVSDPEDSNEIAKAIIDLAENPELRKKLGKLGKDRVLKDFNWPDRVKMIYKYINII